MNALDGLLVGVIFSASLVASLFFVKFWRATRDQLFLAFAVAFAIEGVTRLVSLFGDTPNDLAPLINFVRLVGYLIIIVSIVIKNRRPPAR
jgi:hypothetical protein